MKKHRKQKVNRVRQESTTPPKLNANRDLRAHISHIFISLTHGRFLNIFE